MRLPAISLLAFLLDAAADERVSAPMAPLTRRSGRRGHRIPCRGGHSSPGGGRSPSGRLALAPPAHGRRRLGPRAAPRGERRLHGATSAGPILSVEENRPARRTWIPPDKPERVTPARPRRTRPAGGAPTGPLALPSLPPRVLPAPLPESSPPEESLHSGAATGPGCLSPAALLAAGATAYRPETLKARFDLDDTDLAELATNGALLEVRLGAGVRYVLAEALPAGAAFA